MTQKDEYPLSSHKKVIHNLKSNMLQTHFARDPLDSMDMDMGLNILDPVNLERV